jgi:hypothetical protein
VASMFPCAPCSSSCAARSEHRAAWRRTGWLIRFPLRSRTQPSVGDSNPFAPRPFAALPFSLSPAVDSWPVSLVDSLIATVR